jgi:hypothetical protein
MLGLAFEPSSGRGAQDDPEWRFFTRPPKAGLGATERVKFPSHLKLNCLESFLYLEPAALETVIEDESCQISHTHIPHSSAGSDHKDKKILFFQFYILDNQS